MHWVFAILLPVVLASPLRIPQQNHDGPAEPRAQFSYTPVVDGQINLKKGETVTNIEHVSEDWTKGTNSHNQTGYFPRDAVDSNVTPRHSGANPVDSEPDYLWDEGIYNNEVQGHDDNWTAKTARDVAENVQRGLDMMKAEARANIGATPVLHESLTLVRDYIAFANARPNTPFAPVVVGRLEEAMVQLDCADIDPRFRTSNLYWDALKANSKQGHGGKSAEPFNYSPDQFNTWMREPATLQRLWDQSHEELKQVNQVIKHHGLLKGNIKKWLKAHHRKNELLGYFDDISKFGGPKPPI